MGLDMFLTREIHIFGDERKKLKIEGIEGVDITKVKAIKEEVMYWRKANAIHRWFVENIQNGNDDCGTYYIEKDDLKKLLDAINSVLLKGEDSKESHAKVILPPQAGFFFGSTEVDDWYWEDMKTTKLALEKILKTWDNGWCYYYSSSW